MQMQITARTCYFKQKKNYNSRDELGYEIHLT